MFDRCKTCINNENECEQEPTMGGCEGYQGGEKENQKLLDGKYEVK